MRRVDRWSGICVGRAGLMALLVVMMIGCGDNAAEPLPLTVFATIEPGSMVISQGSAIYAVDTADGTRTDVARGQYPDITPDGGIICVDSLGLIEYRPGESKVRRILDFDEADGNPQHHATAIYRPKVSPDGAAIAYLGDSGHVFVVDRDGGDLLGAIRSTKGQGGYATVEWGTNNRIVFAGSNETFGVIVSAPPYTDTTRIAWKYDIVRALDVHPDGTRALFRYRNGLASIDLDGMNDRVEVTGYRRNGPVWLPDGERIFMVMAENARTADSAGIYNPADRSFDRSRFDSTSFQLREWGWDPVVTFR